MTLGGVRGGRPVREHVLHVTDCYDGGVSRAINDYVTNTPHLDHSLAYRGTETPPPGLFKEVLEVGGSTTVRMRRFRRAVRLARPSLVHLHSSWAGGFVRLGPRQKIPVVYQPHCYRFVDPSLNRAAAWTYRLAEQLLLRGTTVTVVLTPAERRAAEGLGADRLAELPNIPSLPRDEPILEAAPRHRVLMVGRLAAQKDPEFFLEVVQQARALLPDLEAVWIGDGEERLRSLLESEGVKVTGWLDTDGVRQVFAGGGVYAHSARYEGFPLSVLEAAQLGVAVVVRRIDSFTGINELHQLDSAEDLAAEVVRLVQDRAAYREVLADGRRLLARHTPERQAQALRELYDSVLAR